ncbi:MAG TPA: hypothetical protein VM782_13205, partial [Stellaceae bacterium]|nr:hypothetical protein [Stellaceae bacterium]
MVFAVKRTAAIPALSIDTGEALRRNARQRWGMNDIGGRDILIDPVARTRALGPAILDAADTIEKTRRIPEPLLTEL